jgi:hypothetical protein
MLWHSTFEAFLSQLLLFWFGGAFAGSSFVSLFVAGFVKFMNPEEIW